MMRYLSLFSGIEAASVAWHPLGWQCAGVAEVDPFACAVLQHRFPDVPNLGSVTDISDDQVAALGALDVVVGGSPCQDLSIAGKRAGLAGARSNLFFEHVRIFNAARHLCGARWFVWENVPGAFSSRQGRDFAAVVGALAGIDVSVPVDGWGTEGVAIGPGGLLEWCVLDAQFFGVAQRRRRVFAVLDAGDWGRRGPVLVESEGMRGNHPPRRGAGPRAANDADGCAHPSCGGGLTAFGGNNTAGPIDVATACLSLPGSGWRGDFESETFLAEVTPFDTTQITHPENRSNPQPGDPCPTLPKHGDAPAIVWTGDGEAADAISANEASTYTHEGTGNFRLHNCVQAPPAMRVRRLTPRECERLQGFPDDWTLIPWRGKPADDCSDGPRYRALGNSMAVPVMRWIGQQLQRAHNE